MIPQALEAMLACQRLGAIHSVVFGGFASHELAIRIQDATPKLIISSSFGLEGMNKTINYKEIIDDAFVKSGESANGLKSLIYHRENLPKVNLQEGRDYDWETLVNAKDNKPMKEVEAVSSTDPMVSNFQLSQFLKEKSIFSTQVEVQVSQRESFVHLLLT